ncbi:YphA family membrane protein [Pontibacillus yanchengensis]|uniref:Uncharacterized protein n=2 Tax=Pontibacillus yanchengensis TaxID=462910 RepID=A0A6I4ZY24_9BACI|nr:hypothetical protein [Pontibacillus yanchengensis]MYL32732.1 hypothetical protein [Pontibacillus yanchengensis]
MEGIYFYYTSWFLWVMFTFLSNKTSTRFYASLLILLLLNSVSYSINIGSYNISLTAIIIIVSSLVILSLQKQQVKAVVISISIGLGYTGALFWEAVSPVWLVLPRLLLVTLLAYLLVYVAVHQIWMRIGVWGLGSVLGEVIYSIYVGEMGYREPIGEMAYLDMYSLVIFMVLTTTSFLYVVNEVEGMITQRIKRKVGMKP